MPIDAVGTTVKVLNALEAPHLSFVGPLALVGVLIILEAALLVRLTIREVERGADVVLAIRGEWDGEKKAVMRGGEKREESVREIHRDVEEAVIPHSPSACDHRERPYGG